MSVSNTPVVVITGGRRGIGWGIARTMARAGYCIAITGLSDAAQARDAVVELQLSGKGAIYIQSDLSNVRDHKKTVDTILKAFGRIDCLVNNAAINSVAPGDMLSLAPGDLDTVFATNVRGTVCFTQAVVSAMLEGKAEGTAKTIINVTSLSAAASSLERVDYCMSKAAISAFSQGLALRLAPDGISVFEVRPGIIRTDRTKSAKMKYDALIDGGVVPARRWGEPEDIGAICSSLASGAFEFATGSIINADGGLSIPRL